MARRWNIKAWNIKTLKQKSSSIFRIFLHDLDE
jgi:hypothetical protein